MPHILVERPHKLPIGKARKAADKVAEDLAEAFQINYGWDGDVMRFSRPGVNGEIRLVRNQVAVEVELGWLLSPLRTRVEQEIHRYLEQEFGAV